MNVNCAEPCLLFFLGRKQETQGIFSTFETKEGTKYLEHLAWQYMGKRKI